jgi:hypothetical protein
LAFFLNTNGMMNFFSKFSFVLRQKGNFFAKFFGENILKIINWSQIGRFFAQRVMVYFGQFVENYRSSPPFLLHFSEV